MRKTVRLIHVCGVQQFRVGDPCPDGYLDRQTWADVHMKAKIKQVPCGECGRWRFLTEPECCAVRPLPSKKGKRRRG